LLLKHLYKQDWKSVFIKLLHRPDDFIDFTLDCPPKFYNKIALMTVGHMIVTQICLIPVSLIYVFWMFVVIMLLHMKLFWTVTR